MHFAQRPPSCSQRYAQTTQRPILRTWFRVRVRLLSNWARRLRLKRRSGFSSLTKTTRNEAYIFSFHHRIFRRYNRGANMSSSVVTITADDATESESLKIEFTPPTTAGSTTVIRVVATVYLTEVGY